jgi:hypothetical protein
MKTGMKRVIVSILVIAVISKAYAQQPGIGIDLHKFKYRAPSFLSDSLSKLMANTQYTVPYSQAQLSHTLRDGDKLYLLPQDRMPCVVTDMSHVQLCYARFKRKSKWNHTERSTAATNYSERKNQVVYPDYFFMSLRVNSCPSTSPRKK